MLGGFAAPVTSRWPVFSVVLTLFLTLLQLAACSGNVPVPQIDAHTGEPAKPWTRLDVNDAFEDFTFVVVTDRTGSHRHGVFEQAMPKVNLLEPAFVVSVGDLIEGYTDDPVQLEREWNEIEDFIAKLDMPFFYTAGNHDMSNAVMAETWRERFARHSITSRTRTCCFWC